MGTNKKVHHGLLNRRRFDEIRAQAKDDEVLLCGTVRCLNCDAESLRLYLIPDWKLAPTHPFECEECGSEAAVYKLDETFVRVPSNRQEQERKEE